MSLCEAYRGELWEKVRDEEKKESCKETKAYSRVVLEATDVCTVKCTLH